MALLSVVTKPATLLHNLTAYGECEADGLGEDMKIGETYAERKEGYIEDCTCDTPYYESIGEGGDPTHMINGWRNVTFPTVTRLSYNGEQSCSI